MATKNNLPMREIGAHNKKVLSRIRTTIERAYYRNNVVARRSSRRVPPHTRLMLKQTS